MGDLTPVSSSFYWFPQSEEQVPLKCWYEARTLAPIETHDTGILDEAAEEQNAKEDAHEVFNGGIMGHGIGFSRILARLPELYENITQ